MSSFQWPPTGGSGSGVASLNTLTGILSLVAGSNITITPSGSNITIASATNSIGETVTGGVANQILFINPTATLAQSSNFTWNNSTQVFGVTGEITASNSGLPISIYNTSTTGSGTSQTVGYFHQSIASGEAGGNPVSIVINNDSTSNSTRLGTDGLVFSYSNAAITGSAALDITAVTTLTLAGSTASLNLGSTVQFPTLVSAPYLYTDSSGNVTAGAHAVGTISSLTGDVTGSGTGAVSTTLATVNTNTGSFGSSTSIPNFTVNGKGLITAAGGNAVVAPAGTLSGTTLASNVVTSSLTTVSTIGTGTWQGTAIGTGYGGLGASFSSSTGAVTMSSGTVSVGSIAGNTNVVKAPTVQKFTSGSGTYTLPTGPSPIYLKITMVGGGGSGAGGGTGSPTNGTAGGNTTFGTSLLSAGGGAAGQAAVVGTAN